MKKSILMGIGVLAATALFVSCHDDLGLTVEKGNGLISPFVELNTETVTSRSTAPSSRADGQSDAITVNDLTLRLTKADGSRSWEWPLDSFPTEQGFGVGNYTMEAYYEHQTAEGFDCPSFYGSQTLTVKDGETSTVSLKAQHSKSKITIAYTDAFRKYMADWSAKINNVEYTREETRPVYVKPGNVEIKINITKPNGISAEMTLDPVKVEARHHYTITVDVNGGEVGDASLNISFDDSLEQEDINIDLNDQLLSAPIPVIKAKGFESAEMVEAVAGLPADRTLSMSLIAMAGLKEVNLHTESESLIKQGWPEDIDLMTADAAMQTKLTDLGLGVTGLWKNPGEMALLDFTNVTRYMSNTGNGENEFTVRIKDKLIREGEEAALKFNLQNVEFDLTADDQYYEPNSPLKVTLGFNGGGRDIIKEKITIEYKNEISGTWRPLEITDISEGRSRAMLNYTLTVTTPDIEGVLKLRANYKLRPNDEGTYSGEIEIDPYVVQVSPNNVFAKYAYIKVVGVNTENPVTIKITKNGGSQIQESLTIQDGFLKVTNLDPASQYSVEVQPQNMYSKTVEFTTEDEIQLPNSSLDNWSYTEVGSNNNKCKVWNCEGWATFNELTTSKTSGSTYSALSSTLPENETNPQTALIRTVGFDVNSNSILGNNNFQQSSQGELFLGTYDLVNGAAYGITHESRPQAFSFQYKYTPQNPNDKGYAEITLLDINGETLVTKTWDLDKAEAYTEQNVDFEYPIGSPKAAVIKVIFRSTNAGDTYLNSNDIPKKSSVGYLTDYYVGSKLYVDDIQLIY
ncbi:MAG: DUF4493 domain-containing protein [Muribaculaceae bacterium]|nr:DUF4493 domain-containing protein [Muribaculaceae bacterium]